MNDLSGVAVPGASTTRARVAKWFGGPDGGTNLTSKSIIATTFDNVFEDAYMDDDIDIDCETGCDA